MVPAVPITVGPHMLRSHRFPGPYVVCASCSGGGGFTAVSAHRPTAPVADPATDVPAGCYRLGDEGAVHLGDGDLVGVGQLQG